MSLLSLLILPHSSDFPCPRPTLFFARCCQADPTLAFRKSCNGRFGLNPQRGVLRRLERQGFILDQRDGFKRSDSGVVRHFAETPDLQQHNTAFQALFRFLSYFISSVPTAPRPGCSETSDEFISTVFNLRTISSRHLLGEPAAEGVHMDGVEHHGLARGHSCHSHFLGECRCVGSF